MQLCSLLYPWTKENKVKKMSSNNDKNNGNFVGE